MDRKSQANFFKSFILILFFFIGIVFAFQGGDGTLADPYQISNCTELQNMSKCLSCNYTLVSDVDCSMTSSWNGGWGFEPIGNCTGSCDNGGTDFPFLGFFDGQNYEIQSLFINRTSPSNNALFRHISPLSTIANVKMVSVNITGSDYYVASLVSASFGSIINSSSTGTLVGNHYIGGLVADQNTGRIDNCYSTISINGGFRLGGLVAFNSFAIINNSYSTGHVVSNYVGYSEIGGLVGGNNFAKIYNSYSTGDVTNTVGTAIGGLLGSNNVAHVYNSYSTGNVNGLNRIGGLVGSSSYSSSVVNSYSTGSVNGSDYIGGLVGYNYDSEIDNCYSTSDVSGINNVGGLIGLIDDNSEIYDSYSTGNILGTNNVGGLIGNYISGTIVNTYWYNISSNINQSFGTGFTTGVFTNDTLSYFYDCSNEPMASWDTVNNWTCSGLGFPQLAWAYVPSASSPSSLSSIFPFENVFSLTLTMFIVLSYLFLS